MNNKVLKLHVNSKNIIQSGGLYLKIHVLHFVNLLTRFKIWRMVRPSRLDKFQNDWLTFYY